MKKLKIPYKITRTDLPGNCIVLKVRTLGLPAMGPVIILPLAITILLLYRPINFLTYTAICAGILLLQPYICRFSIKVSPALVTIKTKYLGITVHRIEVPFQNVLVMENGFRDINEGSHDHYHPNNADFLALEFDNRWDGPVDYVTLCFKGKEYAFGAWQASFETELWQHLTGAIRQTYAIAQK